MAGLGQSFVTGQREQATYDQLEQERQLKLQQMQLLNESNQHNYDRQLQQEDYQDKQRETAQQLLQVAEKKEKKAKEALKVVATTSIDKAILESGKNNYEPLKKILLNNTPDNPNKEVKSLIEKTIGGRVIDVRHPDPANLPEGEKEFDPDAVEIEYIDDAGEKHIRHMSALQLGISVGTPNRVGIDEFHKHLDGSLVPKKSPTDLAKSLSISFDGQIKGLKENLTIAASVGNDPKAKKLLDIISETSAKDGTTLLQALTAEYGKAKDPAEKRKILKRIQEVGKLIDQFNEKKNKTDQALSKSKLQGMLAQAVMDGDEEGIERYTKALTAIDKVAQANKPLTKAERDAKKEEEIEQKHEQANTYENILNGKADPEVAVEKITSGDKWQAKVNSQIEATKVLNEDKAKDRELDLTNPLLRTGKVSEKGKRLLEYLQKVEEAGGVDIANSTVKHSLDVMKSTTTLAGSMSKTLKLYDTIKQSGLLKGTEKSGLAYMMKEGLKTLIGDPDKGKQEFVSMTKDLDRINELQSKKRLSHNERSELRHLRSRYLQNAERELKTENYFNLKKLLQSISGMGVTNKELEGFKQYFGGADYASLDAMIAKLKAATLAQMHIANGEFNQLMTAGLPYTAYSNVLKMRSEGEYLINSVPDADIARGLNPEVHVAHPMERTPVYDTTLDKFARKVSMPPASVKTLASKLLTLNMQGVNRLSEIFRKLPNLNNTEKKVIKQLIPVLSHIDQVATANKLYDTAPTQPTQQGKTNNKDSL